MNRISVIRCLSCKEVLEPIIKENQHLPRGVKSAHYMGMTATSVKYKSLHLTQNRNCKELDVNEEKFFYSFYHGQVPTVQQYKNL